MSRLTLALREKWEADIQRALEHDLWNPGLERERILLHALRDADKAYEYLLRENQRLNQKANAQELRNDDVEDENARLRRELRKVEALGRQWVQRQSQSDRLSQVAQTVTVRLLGCELLEAMGINPDTKEKCK